jgi:hypothetical protein
VQVQSTHDAAAAADLRDMRQSAGTRLLLSSVICYLAARSLPTATTATKTLPPKYTSRPCCCCCSVQHTSKLQRQFTSAVCKQVVRPATAVAGQTKKRPCAPRVQKPKTAHCQQGACVCFTHVQTARAQGLHLSSSTDGLFAAQHVQCMQRPLPAARTSAAAAVRRLLLSTATAASTVLLLLLLLLSAQTELYA